MTANPESYLAELSSRLKKPDVKNEPINLVFHGHSIPCGYTVNRVIRPFDAYPHLVHRELNVRYPNVVMNTIVTSIGGECAASGARRMKTVTSHQPQLVTVDYGRNDMYLTVDRARDAWRTIIESVLAADSKVLLITPAIDNGRLYYKLADRRSSDEEIAGMISELAVEYEVGCADVYQTFQNLLAKGNEASDYLSGVNHPNRKGHEIIARDIMRWFPIV